VVKPLIDIYANKDQFTGKAIESQSMRRLPKGDRMDSHTSVLAEALGKVNTAVAGAVAGDKESGLSPVKVDHLIKGYFGWLGAMSTATADSMIKPMLGRESSYVQKTMDSGVTLLDDTVNAFVKETPSNQSKYVDSFYNKAKEVSQVMADIKHYREMGDADKANELALENKDLIVMHKAYTHTEGELTKINTQIRLNQAKALPDQVKAAIVDGLMQRRNALVERIEKARMLKEAS